MAILTIARLTLRETSRRRLLLALALLTLLAIGLTAWGFQHITTMRNGDGTRISPVDVKVAVSEIMILLMFMFSGVLALSAVFVAAPTIAGEVESGIAQALLARPLHRRDAVLGKWLGLALVVVLYTICTAGLEFLVTKAVVGYMPPHPWAAIAYLSVEGITLLTLALLFSTRLPTMTGGIVATILFFMAWMGGIVGGFGSAFNNATVIHIGTITRLILPTDGLWRGAIFSLEPSAYLAVVNAGGREIQSFPFYVPAAPPTAYLIWVAGWLIVMLGLAIYSFQRREV